MSRLTYTDEELAEFENMDCPVKANDRVNRFCDRVCDEFQSNCPFKELGKKLKDYEDKEEQGLLIDVPVKPEDDIYFIKLHFNGASRLGKITVDKITIDAFEIRVRGFWYDWNQEVSFTLKEFKKTWFLTEVEAEEALAKMGGK